MSYQLRNPGIASANPSATANSSYINALYQEAYGRNATQAELNQFSNRTVRDAANLILGQSKSPFASGSVSSSGSQPSQPVQRAQPAQSSQSNSVKTNLNDIIATFHRYYGRNPNADDMRNLEYLTRFSPAEVERRLRDTAPSQAGSPSNNQSSQSGPVKTNLSDIIATFHRYYGRQPNADDMKNLEYLTRFDPSEVERRLRDTAPGRPNESGDGGNQSDSGSNTGDSDLTPEQKALIDKLNADIDAMDLSEGHKAILRQIALGNYTSGNKILTEAELNSIIQDAAKAAETDLNPYYERITAQEMGDFKKQLEEIRQDAAKFQEREAVSYDQALKNAKASLRARGLTFSGITRSEMGNEGTLKDDEGVRGKMQTAREEAYNDQAEQWMRTADRLGTAAERSLGTEAVRNLDMPNISKLRQSGAPAETRYQILPIYGRDNNFGYPTEPGQINLDKKAAIEQSKWDRIRGFPSN